ncbi:MAG: TIGR00725 family protein [Desulfuromonas sp.]|uniref:TIGR00725 family protein n=1 Tax=Desulfuromonas sp. TaxID=892 RepID=UPI000CB2CF6B|nr:TIGR00725 family protein [Desulfuromonas sp.]PLX82805.1 MAG: TIGR00725 family protein [Desulfuromonas sp.]
MGRTVIGVVGASSVSAGGYDKARQVGRLLAERGATLVCGGLGGVMEAACRGCSEAGGLAVGLLPGGEAGQANAYVSLAIPTNMGHARNVIIAHTAQALIAVEGEYGTLSEMAIALKLGRPVIALDAGYRLEGLAHAATAEEAVRLALESLGGEGGLS